MRSAIARIRIVANSPEQCEPTWHYPFMRKALLLHLGAAAIVTLAALATCGRAAPTSRDAPRVAAAGAFAPGLLSWADDVATEADGTSATDVTATTAVSGDPPATDPPVKRECDLGAWVPPHTCQSVGCGANGVMNGFPIDAIHPDGCRNHDGARLVERSLRKGQSRCPDRTLDLDSVGGRLVGRDPVTGEVACSGVALVGATFSVETFVADTGTIQTAAIRVAQMGKLQTWRKRVGGRPWLTTYVFVPAGGPAISLCDPGAAPAWRTAWRAGTAPDPDTDAPGADAPTWSRTIVEVTDGSFEHHALIVGGESYTFDGSVDAHDKDPSRWFTIACATGAIGKMRLLGFDATTGRSTVAERQATLKMLTARYCEQQQQVLTVPGVPILWTSMKGLKFTDLPAARRAGPTEAYWGKDGALCLSHSRLWRAWTAVPGEAMPPDCCESEIEFTDRVRWTCGTLDQNTSSSLVDAVSTIFRRKPLPDCSARGASNGAIWKTSTIDHTAVDH